MATLSQLHLAHAANSLRPRHAVSFRPSLSSHQLPLGFVRGGVPCLSASNRVRGVFAKRTEENEVAMVKQQGLFEEKRQGGLEAVAGGVVGMVVSVAGPAYAVMKDEAEEMMRFSPEEWVRIYIATGVWVVLYFIVIPLIVYNYLRLRWYKRNFAETYFQFLLVFIFFPGMLLLAPFINFRRLPQDGAEEP